MSVRALLAGLAVAAGLGRAGAASAQSRRYPPSPADQDAEEATHSSLWSAAVTPERHAYDDLMRTAVDSLAQRKPEATLEAVNRLDDAIRLMPRAPEAYRVRGDAHLELHNWARCAADFAAAEAYDERDDEHPQSLTELHRKLGVCQARAGKLGDAERTLAESVASGSGSGEVAMRLGEIRLAIGKLDEAIASLQSSLDAMPPQSSAPALVHFLLAAAFDRARRPADALSEAALGVRADEQLSTLKLPTLPGVVPGEIDYMMGLAYESAERPRPELALAHFQRFVAAAPDSPWRKRADEHIRELRTSEMPELVTQIGTATLEIGAVRAAVRRAMPPMRACLASFPGVVVKLDVVRAGPRTPDSDLDQSHASAPPDGFTVAQELGALSSAELAGIDRCLAPIAMRFAMPPITKRDTYYRATFYVVGP